MSPKGKPRSEGRLGQQNTLTLTSSAFENNGMIPRRYTCEGENISPPLEISNIPSEAQSLALIVHDGDAPVPGGWTHWLLFNIDSMSAGQISENSIPRGAVEGQTSFGVSGYGGPCPPSGTHHYEFKLYALDSELALDEKAKKADLEHAMEGHVVGITNLIGLYSKQN
ncbi:MAG: hypothetical protein US82_C0028G0003 [Parcubacteria group bacterium GW2011_GWC1_38_22]|nr:MAG: hypothetical protein US82_C0028G0003 [Parcubacteria group bacterium GW2011_GWC1_38_22]